MLSLSRRFFLLSGTAGLSAPLWPQAALAAEPDVIVIGAGAAGIAAARTLLDKGLKVTVVEAADRIGGRVYTETETFGVPYDVGAHWIDYGHKNPLLKFGKEQGFTVYAGTDEEIVYVGGQEATDAEYQAYETAYDAANEEILAAGGAGRDVSAASVVSDSGPWAKLVDFLIGAFDMAKDMDSFSAKDWYNSEDGGDWYCKEGYGALWAAYARGVPVKLSTKVTAIDWGGKGVKVETDKGTLSAKACIVTVSTGVLAADSIRFDPPLPIDKQASFHDVSMGHYNHITLQFDRDVFDLEPDSYLYSRIDEEVDGSPKGMGVLANISGSNISYGDVGGKFAAALEAEGEAAAIDFALQNLRGIFGNDIDKHLVKAVATEWGRNPLTLGAYASAVPGKFDQRKVLRQPVAERVFFAGEACSRYEWATVSGAHGSGIETAQKVARLVKVK